MFPIINLGPLSLPAPHLVLIFGLWLGSALAESRAKKAGREGEALFKVIWISLAAGVLGARLSFIARNPGAFQGEWNSVFSLNPALLDPSGGLMIALVAGYIVAFRNKISIGMLLNDLVPFVSILTSAIYLANFASGSGYGALTDLPWGVDLWGGHRHPVQLYYFSASLVVLYLVVFKRGAKDRPPFAALLSYMIYTAGYLIVLSAFQDPSHYLIGEYRLIQLVSWAVFTSSLVLLKIQTTKEATYAAN